MSSALKVGKKLVELCLKGKEEEAVSTVYSPKIVTIEPFAGPAEAPRHTR